MLGTWEWGQERCSGDTGLRKALKSCERVHGVFLSPASRPGRLRTLLAVAGRSQVIAIILGDGRQGRACWMLRTQRPGEVQRAREDGENFSAMRGKAWLGKNEVACWSGNLCPPRSPPAAEADHFPHCLAVHLLRFPFHPPALASALAALGTFFPSREAGTILRKFQSSVAYSSSPEVDFLSCISPWVGAESMGPLGPPDWLQDLSQVAGSS